MGNCSFRSLFARTLLGFGFLVTTVSTAAAAPAVPSGAHPRLFMSADQITKYAANAGMKGTAAAKLGAACQATTDKPSDYPLRGGSDGDTWPAAAVSCAFA